jgi:hypothetical protein
MDLDYYEEELQVLSEDITSAILSVRRLKGKEKEEKCNDIKAKIQQARKMLKNMRREAKSMDDKNKREKYDEARRRRREQIDDLERKMEMAKEQSDRGELLDSKDDKDKKDKTKKKKKSSGSDDEDIEVTKTGKKKQQEEKDLGEELFKEIFETQEDSIRILQRMIHKADESQALAEETSEMLKIQGEQIQRISARMDELGTNITRGGRELQSLLRKLETEKIIVIIVGLIALGILGLIIWGLINHFCKKCKFQKKKTTKDTRPITGSVPGFIVGLLYDILDV